jgi:hypothetical protein
MAEGSHERWEGEGSRKGEFIALDKKLNALLQRPWCPSLFDLALDRERMPGYLRPDHQLYCDWLPALQLRRALMEELVMQGHEVGSVKT